MTGYLTIVGSKQNIARQRDVNVILNGEKIGEASLTDNASFHIPTGEHTLFVSFRIAGMMRASNVVELHVGDGEHVTVGFSINRLTGGFKLKIVDN